MTARLTAAQRDMLKIIERYAGDDDGWGEVDLQFSVARNLPQFLEASTSFSVANALRRKGLIDASGSPALTPAGRAALGDER